MVNIQEPLERLFKKHRIVFWFDAEKEFNDVFAGLHFDDVDKIELRNNEFSVKYHILRECPDKKFLLYCNGEQPAKEQNWLLDVLLSQGEFRTDQVAMYLADLGLETGFADLVQEHVEFCRSGQRMKALKGMLAEKDTHNMVRLKMVAVCTGTKARLDMVLENLLEEEAAGRQEKFKLLQRCQLDDFLWEQLQKLYGYRSEEKSIHDFKIRLFRACYEIELNQDAELNSEAVIFLKRWKDSTKHRGTFEKCSDVCAEILGIEKDVMQRSYEELLEVDYFRVVDMKLVSELVSAITDRTITVGQCAKVVRDRRLTHWFGEYVDFYEAVEFGSCFLNELEQVDLRIESFSDGLRKYSKTWYRIDQLYRKYQYHRKSAGCPPVLEKLSKQIENLYTNNFLLKLNDSWQQKVDAMQNWQSPLVPLQKSFFKKWVAPYTDQQKKVYVIISDALRFEISEELLRMVRAEDRYQADLEVMVSMLPSYTQLGMAALLPHKELSLNLDGNGTVRADGEATVGTSNRAKILHSALQGSGTAIQADAFLELGKNDCRGLMRENNVLYIYHNRIDAVGDKLATEGKVFEAAEEALKELVKIIKKIAGNNGTNMIVTSDHGFIYQDKVLDESDFSSAEVKGATISVQDRRFVVGKDLQQHGSLKHFTAGQLGLMGDAEFQISKSINRMRLKGSGSRFVHGGSSLQEIVLPVLKINKKRKSDVSAVSVDLIASGSSVITSGQLSVTLYQAEPVEDKILPRTLHVGIYTKDKKLISDSHEVVFDTASPEAKERERKIRFLLNREADAANGQTVFLRLEEKVPGTAQYKEYKVFSYAMQRSFMTDF